MLADELHRYPGLAPFLQVNGGQQAEIQILSCRYLRQGMEVMLQDACYYQCYLFYMLFLCRIINYVLSHERKS